MEKAGDYGVAVMMPPEVFKESFRLVQFLTGVRVPLVYSLSGEFIPHVTLYQGRFPSATVARKAWELLCAEMPKFVKRPVEVRMTRDVELRKNGNIFWNCRRTAELEWFHTQFASQMQAHTEGLLMKQSQDKLQDASEEERHRVMKYGVVASGPAYHPHITLARLRDVKNEIVLRGLNPIEMDFSVEKLCFGPINEYGQMSSGSIEIFALPGVAAH